MSVWARNEQRQLVRIIPPRNSEESIVRHLFPENPTPQMDHPESQHPLFNPMLKGYLLTHKASMNLHNTEMVLHYQQPRRQEGEMLIFSEINIGLLLPLYLMWKEPSKRFCNLKEPKQIHVFAYLKRLTNSL